MMSINLCDIHILNIINCDYCYIIHGISKLVAIILLQNIYLAGKVKHYKNWMSITTFEAVNLLRILIFYKWNKLKGILRKKI